MERRRIRRGRRVEDGRGSEERPSKEQVSEGQRSKERSALRHASTSSKLVRLWRRAAELGASQTTERERVWERLSARLEPLMAYRVREALHVNGMIQPEEVVQDAYLRLIQNDGRAMRRCTAATDSQLVAYVHRICDSCVTDSFRRFYALKRGRKITSRLGPFFEEEVDDPLADVERTYACKMQLQGWRKAVAECSRRAQTPQLATRNRFIFEEAILASRSSGSIANELGLTVSSVDSVVTRMRNRLREDGWSMASRNGKVESHGSTIETAYNSSG